MIIYNGKYYFKDNELCNLITGNIHLFIEEIKTKEVTEFVEFVEFAEYSCTNILTSENEKIIYVDSLFVSNHYENPKLNLTEKPIYIKGFVILKIQNKKNYNGALFHRRDNEIIFTITLTEDATCNNGEIIFEHPFVLHSRAIFITKKPT